MSNAGTRETNEIEGPDKDGEGNKQNFRKANHHNLEGRVL